MNHRITRRDLLRVAVAAPLGAFYSRYAAYAQPYRNQIKITNIRAMAIKNIAGNCLIRIDTDAGLTGYGEAGSTGPMARARIADHEAAAVGKDPLAIESPLSQHDHADAHLHGAHPHHQRHRYGAVGSRRQDHRSCPSARCWAGPSAIRSRCTRTASVSNMLDKASCRDWAQRIKQMPEGFTAFKNGIDPVLGVPVGALSPIRSTAATPQGGARLRQRAGGGGRRDRYRRALPQRTGYAQRDRRGQGCRADESAVHRGRAQSALLGSWMALRRSTRIPLLTGEKLEWCAASGRSSTTRQWTSSIPTWPSPAASRARRKIADIAALTRTPVALHNVGSLVLTYANAHFGSSIQNFYRSESELGRPTHHWRRWPRAIRPSCRRAVSRYRWRRASGSISTRIT